MIPEPGSVLIVVILLLVSCSVGILAGYVFGRTARRRPLPVRYQCGCGCDLSFHDPVTGACAKKHHVVRYDSLGQYAGKMWVTCSCLTYVGERPVDLYGSTLLNLPHLPNPSDKP